MGYALRPQIWREHTALQSAPRKVSEASPRQPSRRSPQRAKVLGSSRGGCAGYRHCDKSLPRPGLNKTDKTVCEHDGPEHQQSDIATEIECESSPKHEEHKAGKRTSLLPPSN